MSAQNGPAAGAGYLLSGRPKVKARERPEGEKASLRVGVNRDGWWPALTGWQEWQGSNLRPPVLEFK